MGWNRRSSITNSYTIGSVTGEHKVGGLLGYTWSGSITNSYTASSVTGNFNVGGLVGTSSINSSITNSFWDTETSGQSSSAGGTGKTTAEMKTQSTFTNAGWDFNNVWAIDSNVNDGYPSLRE